MTDLEDSIREYFVLWKKDGFTQEEQKGAMALSISRILDEVYRTVSVLPEKLIADQIIECPKCGSFHLGWISHPPVDSERKCLDCNWREWS